MLLLFLLFRLLFVVVSDQVLELVDHLLEERHDVSTMDVVMTEEYFEGCRTTDSDGFTRKLLGSERRVVLVVRNSEDKGSRFY